MWCFEVGHPPLFSLNFQKSTLPYLGNRSPNQRKILDLMFGGRNQHVCQISLHSERVGFRIVFFWVIWHGMTLSFCDMTGSPNSFVRGPHELLHNSSRAGHLILCNVIVSGLLHFTNQQVFHLNISVSFTKQLRGPDLACGPTFTMP